MSREWRIYLRDGKVAMTAHRGVTSRPESCHREVQRDYGDPWRPNALPLWKRGNEGDLWRGNFPAFLQHRPFMPTSNLRLADVPGNVLINAKDSGLPKDSVVNVSQIITVDKTILAGKCGRLSSHTMRSVDEALRFVLAL